MKKELGLLGVYALATGTTLSAGFFLLPGLAASEAGPAVPLAYLIAAIPLIPAMLSKVELATAMPRAGGVYYFLDRSMGPLVGTIGGLGTWLVLSLKAAFALIGMGAYLTLVLPGIPILPLAIAFAVLFGALNLLGAKSASGLQMLLVAGLLAILVWFMRGIVEIDPRHFDGFFAAGFDNIISAAGLVYISYIGITKVVSVSEEVKNPEKNLPRGIFLAMATAIVIYTVGTTVMVGVVPLDSLRGDLTPVASAAERLVGSWGSTLMVVAALLAFFSVANASILSASRYPLAMSRDHILPSRFRHFSKKGVPTYGVLATVALILLFLVAFDPVKIAKLASAFQLLLFSLICLAVIVMRESRIDSYDPGYRSPGYPWVQIFGVFAPFLLIAQMGWLPIFFTGGLLAAGTGWFFYYARSRVRRAGAIYHIFERLGRRRFEGLDTELRGILKEKGLRDQDPFDEIVACSQVLDVAEKASFEQVAHEAAHLLAQRVPTSSEDLFEGFMRGTKVGATPVSHGAALPHIRIPFPGVSELVLVRARGGVWIDVVDEHGEEKAADKPVHALFFLVSSEDDPSQHLRVLAQMAGRVDDEDFMPNWMSVASEQELKEALLRDDRYLSIRLEQQGPTSELVGRPLREAGIPAGCLVAIVHRDDRSFVPHGETQLRRGDRLTIIGEPEGIELLQSRFTATS